MSQQQLPIFQLIPDQVFAEGAKKLEELNKLFSEYYKPLTAKQRQDMLKAKDKTAAFIANGGEYSQTHPELLPGYLTAEQMKALASSDKQLRNFLQSLTVFTGNINDTSMVSSGNLFSLLLKFYNVVKEGAKINLPGANEIYKNLSARFPGRKKKKAEPVSADKNINAIHEEILKTA